MVVIRSKNGFILIISLWILAILSLFAIGVAHKISLEIRLLHNHLDSTRAFYIAKAGIKRAIAERMKAVQSKSIYADSFNQPWFDNEAIFKDASLGDGTYTVENPDMPGLYGMSDEQGKVNINIASGEVLEALLKEKGVLDEQTKAIASAIKGWRGDADGAFADEYYQAQDPPYHCKKSKFDAIEEILLVKDMTQEIFYGEDKDRDGIIDPEEEGIKGIKRYITVYGNGTVNINTAPKEVLTAVLGEELADYIISTRAGQMWFVAFTPNPDDLAGQAYINDNTDKIRNIYGANLHLDDDERAMLSKLGEALGTKISVTSSTFRINSAAQVKGIKRQIESVVKFVSDKPEYSFLYWHQE